MQMKRWTVWLCGVGALALVTGLIAAERVGLASTHQKPVPVVKTVPCTGIVSVEGKDNFAAYCSACHGADAKGAGPAAAAMKVPVPDLTTIAKRNGKFDSLAVQYVIAGSGKLATPAHGSTDMPVWGEVFKDARGASGREYAKLRINNLVSYLESIQAR